MLVLLHLIRNSVYVVGNTVVRKILRVTRATFQRFKPQWWV